MTDLKVKALELYDGGLTNRTNLAKELKQEYGGSYTDGTFRKKVSKIIIKERGAPVTFLQTEILKVTGRSTLKDSDGNLVMEWTKTSIDKEQQDQAMIASIKAMRESIQPYESQPFKFLITNKNLCNQYTITDYHLGLMAWGEESGSDWDMQIAEDMLVKWFATAIELSPLADQAIFAQIGDFLHWDGLDAVTPMSKHVLDADTRYTKLVRVAVRVIRRVISMLLEKYPKVHMVMAEGNHDMASSVWLREMFSMFYADEPRLTIDRNPDPYYNFNWGKVCLFYHHGHKRNLKNIDTVFVSKFKEAFGMSQHTYGHTGHLHHDKVNETNLMVIEQHRTLAAKDAYASRGGYMSGRDSKVITYHKEFGEVARNTINPEMLK